MTPFRRGKSGIYSIYIPTGPGLKQRSTGTTSKRLADEIEAMVQALARLKEWELLRAVVNETITLDELWSAYRLRSLDTLRLRLNAKRVQDYVVGWQHDAKRNAPSSWDQQFRQLKVMLNGVTFVHELTAGFIRDRLNSLGVSGGTTRHYLYTLSSFCNYLVAHQALDSNPCESKTLVPRPRKSRKRTVWRTEDVDQRICNRLSGVLRIAAVVCCASGADRSTPFSMRVRDVHLLPPGVAPDPATGLEHRVDLPGTKTEQRARKGVRLEPWAAAILREWIQDKLPDAPLITGARPDTLSDHWKVFAAQEGEKGYWLRDARHSYGCRALLAGYPLWEVSKWLGHGSVATTADIYLQMDYEVARRVREGTTAQQPPAEGPRGEDVTTPRTTSKTTVTKLPVRRNA